MDEHYIVSATHAIEHSDPGSEDLNLHHVMLFCRCGSFSGARSDYPEAAWAKAFETLHGQSDEDTDDTPE